jgi:hypothetical protein
VSADSELERLRSELSQADALAALRADLAAVDADLKRLDAPGLGPSSAVLFYRRYYQREREKITLRIDLLELPRKIETCEWNYKLASSPGERQLHEKHCQMIRQGRALGRSKETSLPPYPEVAAQKSLNDVRGQFRTAELRLQELTARDTEWAEQLRTTAPPVPLATEAEAPAIASSSNIGQPTILTKSTGHKRARLPSVRRPTVSNNLTTAEVNGRRRAKLVGRLIEELNALRPLMQIPEEDYPKLRAKNPKYRVFKICEKNPGASEHVKRVCDRPSINRLAYELAAVDCGVSASTIETAWKRYKPKGSRLPG